MRGLRGKAFATAVVVALLGLPAAASADPSAAVTTAGGACSPADNGTTWSTGVQTQDRDFLLARTTFAGASGSQGVVNGGAVNLGAGDVAWVLVGEPATEVGEPIRGQVDCQFGPLTWSTTFYEVPLAPVSFSGRTTPEPPNYEDRYDSTSRVGFYADAAGRYQATVTTSSGVVKVNAEPPISGSKTISLGRLDAGEGNTVEVAASGLSPAAWTIAIERIPDTSAPEVRFSRQPSKRSSKRRAFFRFSADERADFTCRLDKGPFEPCGSPVKTNRLSLGRHAFAVQATDAAGNQSAPARVRFRVTRRR